MFAGHVVVAAFVALARYPATQDGPAHLYTVHVLRELARDPASPYHRYFIPNIHFGANGLFFYFGIWAGRYWPLERATSLAFFTALVLLPLSALAFAKALAATRPANESASPLRSAIRCRASAPGPSPARSHIAISFIAASSITLWASHSRFLLSPRSSRRGPRYDGLRASALGSPPSSPPVSRHLPTPRR